MIDISRAQDHDTKLKEWIPLRESFLNELLRLDGLRGRAEKCESCARDGVDARGVVRCNDCSGDELFCAECCVDEHLTLPFHRIEVCLSSSSSLFTC